MLNRPSIATDSPTITLQGSAASAVYELLREAYEDTQPLRRLVRSIDPRLAQEIIQESISYVSLAADVAQKFEREDRIPDLLRALVSDRPTVRPSAQRTTILLGLEIDWTAVKSDPARLRQLTTELSAPTRDVLEWQSRLPGGASIRRPELEKLKQRLQDPEARVTALLGEAGSGKSALLATLGDDLKTQGVSLVGIRLDRLPKDVVKPKQFQAYLNLSAPLQEVVGTLAADGPVVVLLDQLDALCDLMTDRVKRLDLILTTITALAQLTNVHVIVACRPHEFGHDIRLRRVDPGPITLELPSWTEIEPHVVSAGVRPEALSVDLKEELRRPVVLHTFLTLLAQRFDATQLTTYQAMRTKLWDLHVRESKHLSRKDALFDLARWIASHEQLVRPVGQMDQYRNELRSLASAGWISFVEPNQVGFRHQSFFDFALAQYFIESEKPLLETILQQQGLWIRRRVWTTLSYLREGHSGQYHKEFDDLWHASGLRRHLKFLLINFLGHVSDPQPFEILRMREALRSESFGIQAWRAVGRGNHWFPHLHDIDVPEQMKGPETSRRVYGLLYRAMRTDHEKVLGLVEAHWTADRTRAELGARLLEQLPEISDTAKRVSCRLSVTLGLGPETFALEVMVLALCELDATAGFTALQQALDAAVERWRSSSPDDYRSQLEAAAARRGIAWNGTEDDLRRRRREALRDLLAEHTLFSQLEAVVDAHPAAFLDAVMPPLERALSEVAEAFWGSEVYEYTLEWPGGSRQNQHTWIVCVADAVRALAVQDVDAFARLLRHHAPSTLATIHHLLLIGLQTAAKSRPDLLIEYFRGDPRRMNVGTLERDGAGTLDLLAKIGPGLPDEYQQSLADLIRAWKSVESLGDGVDPEIRRHHYRHQRAHKLNMLLHLDRNRLDVATRAHIDEERRAIPEEVTARLWRPRLTHAHVVESSMSSENMKKASDDAIVSFFGERPDTMDWSHPQHFDKGGSIEASRELEKLAKEDPLRGLRIARRLPPGTHDRPVGMVFEAVAETELEVQQVLDFFWENESRGFHSPMYRVAAARGLEKLVNRDKSAGLPMEISDRLRQWLDEGAYERVQSDETHKWHADQAIIYHQFGHALLPQGSYSILSCLFAGLLVRERPAWDAWLTVLEEHLDREDDPRVWQSLAGEMIGWVVRADKERASTFLLRLFSKYPELLDEARGLQLLDRLQMHMEWTVTRGWIDSLRARGDDWHLQAFGELLVLRAWRLPDDPWVVRELDLLLAALPSNIAACRGVALMTAELLRELHLDAAAFGRLLSLAVHDDPSVTAALRHAVWAMMRRAPDAEGEALLRCLHEHPQHIDPNHTHNLLEMMGTYVSRCPALVVDLCERLLERTRGRAPELLDLIVTVQDLEGFLERGLDLFERACDLEMFGVEGILRARTPASRPRAATASSRRRRRATTAATATPTMAAPTRAPSRRAGTARSRRRLPRHAMTATSSRRTGARSTAVARPRPCSSRAPLSPATSAASCWRMRSAGPPPASRNSRATTSRGSPTASSIRRRGSPLATPRMRWSMEQWSRPGLSI